MNLILVIIIGMITYLTRLIPFLFIKNNGEDSQIINYLGIVLPYAIIGILIMFSLKSTPLLSNGFNILVGYKEFSALFIVIALQVLFKKDLLSIALGTFSYIILSSGLVV